MILNPEVWIYTPDFFWDIQLLRLIYTLEKTGKTDSLHQQKTALSS